MFDTRRASLLALHERSREWRAAAEVAARRSAAAAVRSPRASRTTGAELAAEGRCAPAARRGRRGPAARPRAARSRRGRADHGRPARARTRRSPRGAAALGHADGGPPGRVQPRRGRLCRQRQGTRRGGCRAGTPGGALSPPAEQRPAGGHRPARRMATRRGSASAPRPPAAQRFAERGAGPARLGRRRIKGRARRRRARRRKPFAAYRCAACAFEAQNYFGSAPAAWAGDITRRCARRISDDHPSRERLARARVLVVGDAMLDWTGSAPSTASRPRRRCRVRVNREEERPGGAANVALNVKTLGAQATLLTGGRRRRTGAHAEEAARTPGRDRAAGQRPAALHHRQAARDRALAAAHPHRLREPARPRGAGGDAGRLRTRPCPNTTRCCSPTTARAA